MEIRKKYNPLTRTYEYYNLLTNQWERCDLRPVTGNEMTIAQGGGVIDTLASIASKVTSDTAKELAKSVAKTTLESASKKPVMNWVNML